MVLSTATRSEAPRPGATLAPERGHRGEDVLGGQDPRRLHQAGGQAFREGDPDLPAHGQAPEALFPKGYHYEIQVIGTVLVADQETPYDTVSMVGASAALSLSDIPYDGPIGAVRVGRDPDGGFILNPTYQQLAESDLDLVVAGTKEAITMVEAGANEVTEDVMVEALGVAQEVIRQQAEAIEAFAAEHGKEKQQFETAEDNPFVGELREKYLDRVKDAIVNPDRRARHSARRAARRAHRGPRRGGGRADSGSLDAGGGVPRALPPGPQADRPARFRRDPADSAEVGVLPRVHGTGLFTRGETQVLSSLALADMGLVQRLDTLEPQTSKRYMHHYNFPPYSTGETGRLGRRGGVRSGTARSPSGRSCRSYLTRRASLTRSGSSPRCSSPTGPPRWRACRLDSP